MLIPRRAPGFTLIELLVAMAILIITLGFGLSAMSGWLQNGQIRTAAEDIMGGLRAARLEALRRNAHVEFVLTSPATPGGTGWTVREANTVAVIQQSPNAVGTRQAIVRATPADATTVTFNGFGLVSSVVNADGSAALQSIAIDSATLAAEDSRDLRVSIPAGGAVRMCDPKVTDSLDPRRC